MGQFEDRQRDSADSYVQFGEQIVYRRSYQTYETNNFESKGTNKKAE